MTRLDLQGRYGSSVLVFAGLLMILDGFVLKSAAAQPKRWPEAPETLEFSAVADLHQSSTEGKVAGGSVADPKDWPASFFAKYTVGGQTLNCTSTLVASRSLLTAAHCIAEGGTVSIEKQGHLPYTGTCHRMDSIYPAETSADWAMCLMHSDVPAGQYETISFRTALIGKDRRITLAGYGCQPSGTGAPKFLYGYNTIQTPLGESRSPIDPTTAYPNFVSTYAATTGSGAYLCEGDSGGAVFSEVPGFERTVVAVNSSFDESGNGVSYLSALSAPGPRNFLESWSQNTQKLCGVDVNAENCRN
jgi:hypothetical protein